MIHFLRATTGLLGLGPRSFNNLPTRLTATVCIVQRELVLTVVLVTTKMEFWNEELDFFQYVHDIREVFGKALDNMSRYRKFKAKRNSKL